MFKTSEPFWFSFGPLSLATRFGTTGLWRENSGPLFRKRSFTLPSGLQPETTRVIFLPTAGRPDQRGLQM